LENHIPQLIADLTDRFCLLCFGRDRTSEHMWDNYGDRNHGICLGFDIKKNMLSDVQYVPELLVKEIPRDLLMSFLKRRRSVVGQPTVIEKRVMDYVRPFLVTKFDKWHDEKECRAFLRRDEEENGFYFAKLGTQGLYLEEIILGRHCDVAEHQILPLVKDYLRQPIIVCRQP
jgi:hypothetical protein